MTKIDGKALECLNPRNTEIFCFTFVLQHNYDIAEALKMLVPTTGPMLCRDEMEDWSASEANLFEEAIEKYGKDFNDIRRMLRSFGGSTSQR